MIGISVQGVGKAVWIFLFTYVFVLSLEILSLISMLGYFFT